jgi:Reverse transcriptase (RNA-dependent DNA polymerase)
MYGVLDPKLQDGHSLPKFQPRSRRGVFMGFSLKHASTVPLILNLSTGSITPQYHVVFDDAFTSVVSDHDLQLDSPIWGELFNNARYLYQFDEDDDVKLSSEWDDVLAAGDAAHGTRDQLLFSTVTRRQRENTDDTDENAAPATNSTTNDSTTPSTDDVLLSPSPPTSTNASIPGTSTTAMTTPTSDESQFDFADAFTQSPIFEATTPSLTVRDALHRPRNQQFQGTRSSTPRRSGRVSTAPKRYGYDGEQGHGYVAQVKKTSWLVDFHKRLASKLVHPSVTYLAACYTCYETGSIEFADPSIYVAVNQKTNENDTLRYHEALLQPDWPEFQLAAVKEVRTLEDLGTWKEIRRDKVPTGKKIVGGTWVFRCKRDPTGKITKHKGRYCVRGDQQVAGIDYFETYAPVCMWSTVRLMFVLSLLAGWVCIQADYTNAFAQAILKEIVYIEIPRGFEKPGFVLKLIKSLYGLVQAPRTFYEYLTDNLKKFGFECDVHVDPCLWYNRSRKIICVVYVDDCLFYAKEVSTIKKFLDEIGKVMPLTVEEEVTAFLGVQVKRSEGKIMLAQPSLIKQVIAAVGMTDCNVSRTPAVTSPLGSDVDGESFNEKWGYSSVVGMLMYLANNTRPDIAFAVHQCARFTHAPKNSHSLAVKRIVRYLQGSQDKGMVLTPSKNFSVDCYVDADFAGLYGYEDNQDPVSVKSRTGYVFYLADCPLVWVSKLQTEIASSTMEAEYVALSTAMKELIPLRRLTKLACDLIFGVKNYEARMYSSVFEDNNGALHLARAPRMTPRTKHYGIKYHFFRTHVEKQEIKLFKVESKEQRADIMTKGLVQQTFEYLQKFLCGW